MSVWSVIKTDNSGKQLYFETFTDPTDALGCFESAAQEFGSRVKVFKNGREIKHRQLLEEAERYTPGIKKLRSRWRPDIESL